MADEKTTTVDTAAQKEQETGTQQEVTAAVRAEGQTVRAEGQTVQAEGQAVQADDGQAARLARIEELLQQQLIQNVKLRRSSAARTVVMIIMVALFAVTIGVFYTFIQHLTVGVPKLIEDANQLVIKAGDDLDEALKTIESIDFKGINEVIGGVAAVDFEALNTSITGLAEAVENFRAFTALLRDPFGLGS